jgi:hypothetical protein
MNDSALLLVAFYKRATDSGVFIFFLIFSYFIKITTSVGVMLSPTSAYIIYNLF